MSQRVEAVFRPREPTVAEIQQLWDVVGAVLDEVENAEAQPQPER